MTQVNPKITNIAVPAQGGVPVNIVLTIMASKVEVMEDPTYNNGAGQGLQGYYIDTQPGVTVAPPAAGTPPPQASPANQQVWLANNNGQTGRAYQPIIFGGQDGRVHGAHSNFVGAAGTVILQLTSNSELATGVILVEWP
jgi:hypothetical protein